jgi:hypothetical protein
LEYTLCKERSPKETWNMELKELQSML